MSASPHSALGIRDLLCQSGPLTVRAGELEFSRGSLHLLRGEAGSGHELLLRTLGLLEVPEAGEVFLEGVATRELADEARLKMRERRLGFVFTAPFLLPAFTVIENIAMPLFKVSEVEPAEARQRGETLLGLTGLSEFSGTPCSDLSPLQQHRVALSRALVNEPAAVLVENLDTALADENLRAFASLLRIAASRLGVAVIATVSSTFSAAHGDRQIDVADGFAVAAEVLPRADA